MTKRRLTLLAMWIGVVCVADAASVRADGFYLSEQSAEGLGMGSAVSASTSEPAAVWYNPAALAFMPGYQASLVGTGYVGNVSFTPRSGGSAVDAKPVFQLVPGLFATGKVSERVAVGLGVNVPFGLGIEWPDDWGGRLYAIKSSITIIDINPVVSLRVLSNLSVAVGMNVMRGAVDITNGLPTDATDTVRIGGTAWGLGANIAILYKLAPEQFHLAATYRSRVKLNFAGRAHFETTEPVFSSQLFDQPGKASLTLPDLITLGAMYRPTPALRIGLDGQLVMWSTYRDVPVDFSNPVTPDSGFRPHYHNIVNVRLGAEWSAPLPGLKLRAGFVYDPSPAPASGLSPSLPDAVGLDFCLGVGYHTDPIGVDLGYMLVYFLPAKARFPSDLSTPPQSPEGTYRTIAHLIGLTIRGRIGA
jgi:long-chain fatty acid transport protein